MQKSKTILAIFLIISLILSFTACGGDESAGLEARERQTSEERDSSRNINTTSDSIVEINNPETTEDINNSEIPEEIIIATPTADWERAVKPPSDLSPATKDDFSYKYDSSLDGIIITKYTGSETSVLIPETIEDERVIKLDKDTFANNKIIEYIYFPSSLNEVHGDAFKGCSNLTLTIPENIKLTNVESHFLPSVKNLMLSDNMLRIDDSAYLPFFQGLAGSNNIESVKYNNKEYIFGENRIEIVADFYSTTTGGDYESDTEIAKIWDYIYVNFSVYDHNIEGIAITQYKSNSDDIKITFPSEIEGTPVVRIGSTSSVFRTKDKSKIIGVTIPEGVMVIGNSAFAGADNITSITLPDSIMSIYDSAFKDMKKLKTINLPDNIMSIHNDAFSNCTSLTSITLPSSLKHIGSAFINTNLKDLTIPNSVESCKIRSDNLYAGGTVTYIELTKDNYVSSINRDSLAFENNITVTYRGVQYDKPADLLDAMEPYLNSETQAEIKSLR